LQSGSALIISAWAAYESAVGQEPVRGVAVVELIVLHLIALATIGVVDVRVE